jgi:ABC-type antimicrobial peptide transport system permease subunit
MVGGKVLGYNVQRSATPVTLNAVNTNPLNSQYTIPAIVIAIIIIIVVLAIFYLLPRRKIQTS